MGIGRGKEAFHLNVVIDLPGKTRKLTFVHLLTHKLIQSSFERSLLGRTVGHGDDYLVGFLFYIKAAD